MGQVLKVGDIDVHVDGEGDRIIVMVHGWPDTWRLWDRQVAALSATHRCARFSLPGFEPGQPRRAYSLEELIAAIHAVVLAVGGGKPVEALAAARAMLACPHPPAHVVISIDPGHFMKPDLFWERSVRFGLMGRADLAELAALSAATGDWSVHEARRTDPFPPGPRLAASAALSDPSLRVRAARRRRPALAPQPRAL